MDPHHSAVIFDVDGPLLDLTAAEVDAYFEPLRSICGIAEFSDDWDGYAIRNDLEIYRQILTEHHGVTPDDATLEQLTSGYFAGLRRGYEDGSLTARAIPGAAKLVNQLAQCRGVALGIATANFVEAARQRLTRTDMWHPLSAFAGGADGGGPKSAILQRVVNQLALPPEKIVFLGDNLNDLDAAHATGVHFIGFHVEQERQERLRRAGAHIAIGCHDESWNLICELLGLPAAPS